MWPFRAWDERMSSLTGVRKLRALSVIDMQEKYVGQRNRQGYHASKLVNKYGELFSLQEQIGKKSSRGFSTATFCLFCLTNQWYS